MGTHPLLSAVWREDNSVHVSCESQGWYPEPKLRWSDQKQDLTPKVLKYNNVSSGLVSVRSWLLVPTSSEVSCSVGLPDGEAKESRMRLEKPAKQGMKNCLYISYIFLIDFPHRTLMRTKV